MAETNPLWEASNASISATKPQQQPPQAPAQPVAPQGQPQKEANPLWAASNESVSPSAGGSSQAGGKPQFMDTNRAPAGEMSWGDVAGKAAENFVPSLKQFGENVITPFTSPIDTMVGLGKIGEGVTSKAKGALGFEQNAEQKEKDEAAINALGRFYADRYGSMEGFKRALSEDPVGILSDLSLPISGGGGVLAKAPGALGKAGEVLATTGRVMDPIGAATMGVEGAAKAATTLSSLPLAWTSGTSMKGLKTAAEAGFTKNPTFWEHAYGAGKPEEVVDAVRQAISDKAQLKSAEYRAGMDQLKLNEPLSYDKLDKALESAADVVTSKGRIINQEGFDTLQSIQKYIDDWRNHPNTTHTLEDFDKLKQGIRDIGYNQTSPGSRGRKVVDDVANSVKQTISDVDKGYADVMENYQKALREINDYSKGLNAGDTSASFRKILNAQRGFGKEHLLEEIAKINPEIPFMIAGQEMRPWMAHGLRGMITSGSALGTGFLGGVPGAVGHLAASSPKVVGTGMYGVGRVSGAPSRLYEALPPGSIPAAQQAGRAENLVEQEEEQAKAKAAGPAQVSRQGRASGGKVAGIMTAEKLMQAAHAAKKANNKVTEQILNQPDEAVVKALDIANQHI